jgi:hypothetical protein
MDRAATATAFVFPAVPFFTTDFLATCPDCKIFAIDPALLLCASAADASKMAATINAAEPRFADTAGRVLAAGILVLGIKTYPLWHFISGNDP